MCVCGGGGGGGGIFLLLIIGGGEVNPDSRVGKREKRIWIKRTLM